MAYKQPHSSAYPTNARYTDSSSYSTSGGYPPQSSSFPPPHYAGNQAYSMQPQRTPPQLPPQPRFDQSYDDPYNTNTLPKPAPRGPRWHPRNWSRLVKLIVGGLIAIVVIIIVIVAAVEAVHNGKYPNYAPLTYRMVDTYEPATFFQNFQYWDAPDPALGFVHYDSQEWALNPAWNTTFSSPQSAFLQVNPTEPNAITGRHSARVASLRQYNTGLFLFDVKHTPHGCGTWPAIWLADQYNWPMNGEIDVVEAVNQGERGNQITLHTTKGCTMKVKRKQVGRVEGTNCWNGTNANEGCGVVGDPNTFGPALNSNGGGVYAAELRREGIRIWFFPRAAMPGDVRTAISSGDADTTAPDPSRWPQALADFPNTDCDVGAHFRNQSIIMNIDLCGQWAGKDYSTQDKCPGKCEDYVAQNPTAFADAFWEVGRFKVFQAA